MASLEERITAKKQMDAAEAELREYVDRPQDAPTDVARHNQLVDRLQHAMAAYLDTLR